MFKKFREQVMFQKITSDVCRNKKNGTSDVTKKKVLTGDVR